MMNGLKFKSLFSDNNPAETGSVKFMNKSKLNYNLLLDYYY